MKKEKEKIIYVLLNFHFPRSKYCWNHLPIKEGNTSVSNYKENYWKRYCQFELYYILKVKEWMMKEIYVNIDYI